MSAWAWFGMIAAGGVLLLVCALVGPLRVAVDADERGAAGSLRWLGWRVAVDFRQPCFELGFLGLRVLRRPLEREDEADRGDPDRPERRRPGRRVPLSAVGMVRLVRLLMTEVRRLARRIRIERLRCTAVIATPDPALTGELYGYACAWSSSMRALVPAWSLDVRADFRADTPRGAIASSVRTRPIWLAGSALRVGWAFMRERRRSHRSW